MLGRFILRDQIQSYLRIVHNEKVYVDQNRDALGDIILIGIIWIGK